MHTCNLSFLPLSPSLHLSSIPIKSHLPHHDTKLHYPHSSTYPRYTLYLDGTSSCTPASAPIWDTPHTPTVQALSLPTPTPIRNTPKTPTVQAFPPPAPAPIRDTPHTPTVVQALSPPALTPVPDIPSGLYPLSWKISSTLTLSCLTLWRTSTRQFRRNCLQDGDVTNRD